MMVSYGCSRGFCFSNATVKSLVVAIIMSVEVSVDMMSLWRNQEKFCSMQTELVAGIQVLWQGKCLRLGPMYHSERSCGDHEPQYLGRSLKRNLILGGDMGVRL